MKAWNYLENTSGLPLNTEIIKQAHGLMMEDEKDVLVGEYRKSPAFASYYIFAPAGDIERYMEDAIFRFHEAKKDDPIMAATNLFGNIINIHPFEEGNGRTCCLILAHVLIQVKCCLFPVILSSFHRRGRRHYIKAGANASNISSNIENFACWMHLRGVKFYEKRKKKKKIVLDDVGWSLNVVKLFIQHFLTHPI